MDTTQNLINALTPFWSTVDWGLVFAAIGFALVVILPGIGSALGVHLVGCTGAGVLSEDPSRFGKILLLQVLPGTQGIYGLLIGFIFLLKLGVMGGSLITPTTTEGLWLLFAALPMAFVGLWSALYQGRVAAAGAMLVAKRASESGKAMIMAAMVETYAVLALLMSFLAVWFMPIAGA